VAVTPMPRNLAVDRAHTLLQNNCAAISTLAHLAGVTMREPLRGSRRDTTADVATKSSSPPTSPVICMRVKHSVRNAIRKAPY